MRALQVIDDRLEITEAPEPSLAPQEVLVQVEATALNRADLLQRRGAYPPPEGASPILGLEMAGTVAEVGAAVVSWVPGDRVCALLAGGGYAERVAVHQDMLLAVPDELSMVEAAAIPEVFLTAFQALHWLGELEAGERVLLHAGASGVGTAAIQLVRYVGATPYVTASAGKHAACLGLGAEAAIDYQNESFADRIAALTDEAGVELIVDVVGAPYLEPNIRSLALDGRIVLLAMMGGATVEAFDLRSLFRKRGRLTTSTLRSRPLAYKIRLTQDFRQRLWPAFVAGDLRPVIHEVFDWVDAEAAHETMRSNANVGKLVLRVR